MNHENLRSMAAAALCVCLLAGCSTLEYVEVDRARPESLRSQLEVGETVIIRLYHGERRQFRIVALEPDAIVGSHERVAYRDIDLIEVEKRDVGGTMKTALAVGALAVVAIAVLAIEAELEEEPATRTGCNSTGSGVCTSN